MQTMGMGKKLKGGLISWKKKKDLVRLKLPILLLMLKIKSSFTNQKNQVTDVQV